jgi:hypothetical protein
MGRFESSTLLKPIMQMINIGRMFMMLKYQKMGLKISWEIYLDKVLREYPVKAEEFRKKVKGTTLEIDEAFEGKIA